jgi:hypothetical protein
MIIDSMLAAIMGALGIVCSINELLYNQKIHLLTYMRGSFGILAVI